MTDAMKHTPGEWYLDGRTVRSREKMGLKISFFSTGYAGDSSRKSYQISEEEAEANARLSSSAPDLLKSLIEVMAILKKEAPGTALNNKKYDQIGIAAYAAIAKAGASL